MVLEDEETYEHIGIIFNCKSPTVHGAGEKQRYKQRIIIKMDMTEKCLHSCYDI